MKRYLRDFLLGVLSGLLVGLFLGHVTKVHARDLGQWDGINNDPAIREWYQNLRQPDSPAASCCGEADAYWCDDLHTKKNYLGVVSNWCTITDDRPDEPRMRPHIAVGTEIEIPNNKLKWGPEDHDPTPEKNPTGHGIVFLSRGWYVYCYVQAGGA